MDYNTEILSFWIGPHSQQASQHFYSLQAEQFFDEDEDPTNHRALWTYNGNNIIEKTPKMMVFDTKSDHLTRIRKVNHAQILKKMSQVAKSEYSFNYFSPSQQEEEEIPAQDPNACLFQNWDGKQENYVLIDTKFSEDSRAFDHWQTLYQAEADLYEDKIRKRLEKLDYLHVLSFCSDGTRLGFTHSLLSHLQDQCPKKYIVFTNLSQHKNQEYISEVCLPLLSEITQEASILIDFQVDLPEYTFFQSNFYHHLSPLFNCLLTPFMLKKSNSHDYFDQICEGKRSLFDLAYTLPIISQTNSLSNSTNIFGYSFDSSKAAKNQQLEEQNRINYSNKTFLNVPKYHNLKKEKNNKSQIKLEKVFYSSQKILSQAYVLKGHFNQITQLCKQRSPKFDIKYLQGIFLTNPEYKLKYNEFYKKLFGQEVEAFPMHTVLYQNSAFGPSIRNYLKQTQYKGFKNELINEWKEGAISLADLYSQQNDSD